MRNGRSIGRRGRAVGEFKTAGFAYVFLLAAVATIGMLSATSLSLGNQVSRRDAERELLAIGGEFEQALKSYAGFRRDGATAADGLGPHTLQELLKDPRVPFVKRHLRQIYADPLTGRSEWGLVIDPTGSIVGIYSMSDGLPIQRSGFDPSRSSFENAKTYASWVLGLTATGLPDVKKIISGATLTNSGEPP